MPAHGRWLTRRLSIHRCGFNKHSGRLFAVLDDGTSKGTWNSSLIVRHSVDFLESRKPWTNDGRPGTVITLNNTFDCRTWREIVEEAWGNKDKFTFFKPGQLPRKTSVDGDEGDDSGECSLAPPSQTAHVRVRHRILLREIDGVRDS